MRRVDGAKVTRLTPGDLFVCRRLARLRGVAMGGQKSAEAIGAAAHERRRAEHEEPNRHGAFDDRRRRRQEG